jgi:hypothetical protein
MADAGIQAEAIHYNAVGYRGWRQGAKLGKQTSSHRQK